MENIVITTLKLAVLTKIMGAIDLLVICMFFRKKKFVKQFLQ